MVVETVTGVSIGVGALGGGGDGLSMDGSTDAAISAMPGKVLPKPDLSLRERLLGGWGLLIILPHRSVGCAATTLNRGKDQPSDSLAQAIKIAARVTSVKERRQRRLDVLFLVLRGFAHYWRIRDCRVLVRRLVQLRHTHVAAILYSL